MPSITPYQIIVPILSLFAITYAWTLTARQKKTIFESLLWTLFWGTISAIALMPGLLSFLSVITGIKSRENAVLVTAILILSFVAFSVIIRLTELEQRTTRIIRSIALRDLPTEKREPEHHNQEK